MAITKRAKWEEDYEIELDVAFENTSPEEFPTRQDFLDSEWKKHCELEEERQILNKGY